MTDRRARDARILVVDDESANVRLMEAILTPRGYDVPAASSGEDALAMIAEAPPDLVLMDLQLPCITGTEALRRMRSHPSSRGVPVVAVTPFAMRKGRELAEKAGFDGFVEKPISTRDLPAQAERFLEVGHG